MLYFVTDSKELKLPFVPEIKDYITISYATLMDGANIILPDTNDLLVVVVTNTTNQVELKNVLNNVYNETVLLLYGEIPAEKLIEIDRIVAASNTSVFKMTTRCDENVVHRIMSNLSKVTCTILLSCGKTVEVHKMSLYPSTCFLEEVLDRISTSYAELVTLNSYDGLSSPRKVVVNKKYVSAIL